MDPDFIYLDYNATTPIDPRVAEAMQPYLTGCFGNPSSGHRMGREARAAVDRARNQVAGCLGCDASEVVLTSGGSESNNYAIRGVVSARGGGHVVTSAVEHPAVLEVVQALERAGRITTTIVGVDRHGRVDPNDIEGALRSDTILVTLMLANNEVGTLQPVAAVAGLCRDRGILIHTDAAQAVGKIPVNVSELGVDLLSVAGHKLYAPKGIGALFVRDGVHIEPLIRGAAHERGRRAGTENVLCAVGLGEACEIVSEELSEEIPRLQRLRDRLEHLLCQAYPDAVVHGDPHHRLPNTLSIALPGIDANRLLAQLADRLAASAGAACHSDSVTISHVLAAMNVPSDLARSTVRFSMGRFTSPQQLKLAGKELRRGRHIMEKSSPDAEAL